MMVTGVMRLWTTPGPESWVARRWWSSSFSLLVLLVLAAMPMPTIITAQVRPHNVYTPIPSDYYYHHHHHPELGTFSPVGLTTQGFGAGASASSIGREPVPSSSILATTKYVVTPFSTAAGRLPLPLSHHINYQTNSPQHQQLLRHSRKNNFDSVEPIAQWIPMQGPPMAIPSSTIRPPPPPPPVTGYISFDQYASNPTRSVSTSTSVSSSTSTSTSKAVMRQPVAPAAVKSSTTSTTTTTTTSTTTPKSISPPSAPPATAVASISRKRKGKRRTTTSTTKTTTTTEKPVRKLKETPEFQVPNPNYDYEDDPDYVTVNNNVLKRSPPGASISAIPYHLMTSSTSPSSVPSSSSSSSRRPTLLQRIEPSDVARFRNRAKAKEMAKATKSKSQQLWAHDRHSAASSTTETVVDATYEPLLPSSLPVHDEDEIKQVISTELRKTHLSSQNRRRNDTTATTTTKVKQAPAANPEGTTVAAPIWRVTRVETSMNYSDTNGVNELMVLPYDGGATFESMHADRPTINYVDLVTGESFNPFANSTPPITQDLYNSDRKKERKQIQHQLLYNDDSGLQDLPKLPENKTVDIEDTLSHVPREVPVEPDFTTRLRLKKKHPLLNQDSIITAEQSVTKNGLEISTDDRSYTRRNVTTPMTTVSTKPTPTTTTTTSTTFRPFTTSRIILTTRRPSSFTTEILNSWNSPTRTSTYATTLVPSRPTIQTQVTTRRNPATTPAFTSSTTTTTRRPSTTTTRSTTTRKPITTTVRTTTTTTTTVPTTTQEPNNGFFNLFNLLGQTNTNSYDGSTKQVNVFGQQTPQQQQVELESQLSLLESLLQGTQQFYTPITSTTTEYTPPSSTTHIPNDPATLSDSEIKSFLNILGVGSSTSTQSSSVNGIPNNIQAVLEQRAPTPAPTLSTQFVAPGPIATLPPALTTPRPQSPTLATTTGAPSLSSALSNMLAVLSNPFAPPSTTIAPPIQDNGVNNAALLAALLSPQNNNHAANGQSDTLLAQILQLGNSLDPGNGASQNTRQVEATTPMSTTTTLRAPIPTTRVPSLFDFSSLLGTNNNNVGGGGNSWLSNFGGSNLLGQPATTTTTTSNPLAALLDLNRLLFRNNNNNNNNNFGLGNLFRTTQAPAITNPFANLFNFNSLLQQPTAATTQAPAPQPFGLGSANSPIEFHIPTTKRPNTPGPYMWFDVNTFFGGGAGPNDGIRPKFGSRDPFIRV